jgi:hypothetical protein
MSEIEQFRGRLLSHPARVVTKDLALKQFSSVPCPTCGVAAGRRCILHSGIPRTEPHIDRKLAAIEAIKKEE